MIFDKKTIDKVVFLIGNHNLKFYFVIFLFLISSGLEFFSLGLMVPLLNFILGANENTNNIFHQILSSTGIDKNGLLQLLIIIFILRYLLILFTNYIIPKISFDHQKLLRSKILRNYIYSHNNNYSSSDLIQLSTVTLSMFTVQFLTTIMKFLSSLIVIFFISIFLLIFNPEGTFLLISFIFIFFIFYKFYFKNKFKFLGDKIINNNAKVINITNEVFKGLQEIRIYNSGKFFLNRIKNFSSNLSSAETYLRFLVPFPRILIEIILVFTFLSVIYFFFNSSSEIPLVTILVYAYAALRILPFTSELITSLNVSRSATKTVDDIYEFLKANKIQENKLFKGQINFKSIEAKNLSFKYPGSANYLFKNVNFKIFKGDSVAIFGNSGVGKSTLLKLLLGIEKPQRGKIKINNNLDIKKIIKISSYLPQDNFIFKGSVRENILLDETINKEIDEKILKFLKKVNMLEIIKSYPKKLSHMLEENGINISGGQKQRISIARALFHNREILFMDESTSSLDANNEKSIINQLNKDKNLTKIFITHKKKLANSCNVQILVGKKNIIIKRK